MSITRDELDSFHQFAVSQVVAGRESATLADLVGQWETTRKVAQNSVEELLIEGLDSGPGELLTDEWWDRKRDQLVERNSAASSS